MLLVLLNCSPIFAHPHNWIDLNTSFVLDDNARLVQLKQRWEFDVYYSMMTLADIMNEYGSEAVGLPKTARRMVNSLANYDYFSTLRVNGSKIPLGKPSRYSMMTKKRDGETVLELEMTFDLKTKVVIENKTLAWQVFDPSYYIAMNHSTDNNIEVVSGNATECTIEITTPDPADDLIDYAQSLDRNQKDTDGLGEDFSETAFINCY